MQIGLYFGSFNPVHIGHLLVATHIREAANLDEIWFIVSPQNPFKKNNYLAPEKHRLEMVKLAIEPVSNFKVLDIEFNLPKPSYTHLTLKELIKIYPNYDFKLIIGADNLERLHEWKEIGWIMNNIELLVYNRNIENKNTVNIKQQQIINYYQLPLFDISSTEIRNRIKENKSIHYFVTEKIVLYIRNKNLYK
ncbi:MAG: nicotinate (nicotinamide) nucleotide adenylyltransferase [Chitinophagales bacterium]